MNLDQKINALSNPDLYPSQPDTVEVRQTHASAVFLAGDLVYKLKKPVDFGFLNYSTLERREQMCHAEVALNRRLSSGIYLGVSRLAATNGGVEIDGTGPTVDVVVRMKRLSDTDSLNARIGLDSITTAQISAAARKIASFHAAAARGVEIDTYGTPESISRNVNENFQQTQEFVNLTISKTQFDEIQAYASDFLRTNQEVFAERISSGHICDGHGDLRTDHVYFNSDVNIIDCIEFSDRLRYGDVAADTGFLLMDLDAMNRPDLAAELINAYVAAGGDNLEPVDLFYRCYRAYVRGKVAALETIGDVLDPDRQHQAQRDARRYFQLAHRYTHGALRPRLVLLSGFTGTGKSTLAEQLADVLPAHIISSDIVRKKLAGDNPDTRHIVPPGTGIYSPEMTDCVYDELLRKATRYLKRNQTVIVDASWLSRNHREAANATAIETKSQFLFVECVAPPDVVRERLANRDTESDRVSDGRWEIYQSQQLSADPVTEFASREHLVVDTTGSALSQIDTVLASL